MKKDNEWGFYTLPTQTDPEKRAIERLKIASELSLEHYGTPLVVALNKTDIDRRFRRMQ